MNKSVLALSYLEMNLDEWEPVELENGFGIQHRKTGQILGAGKTLKGAIIKARNNEMKKLNRR